MAAPTTTAQTGPGPLHGMALAAGIMVLAMANFMAVLDMTIVNIAIPHIAGSLAISPTEGTWAITSYAVAEAIMVPLTGWLASRFGPVRVFVTATLAFGMFSLLCGLSQSLPMLVFARVMQGVTGGPLMPMSQTLLLRISPPNQRNLALGLWTMTTILGPIAGPLVSGSLADSWGWPWAFFINVPIAVLCSTLAWRMLTKFETKLVKNPIDFVGLALMITWIGALQIMMDNGENDDWFASPFILGLAAIALVGFLAFLAWELTEAMPIVNLRVFRHRSFAVSAIALLFTFGSFMGSIVLIPLWLQLTMNYTAIDSGEIMAMNGMIGIFVAPTAAMLLSKIDGRLMMSTGLFIVAADMFWRTTFNTDVTFWQLAPAQMALGLGMPLFFVPMMSISMACGRSQRDRGRRRHGQLPAHHVGRLFHRHHHVFLAPEHGAHAGEYGEYDGADRSCPVVAAAGRPERGPGASVLQQHGRTAEHHARHQQCVLRGQPDPGLRRKHGLADAQDRPRRPRRSRRALTRLGARPGTGQNPVRLPLVKASLKADRGWSKRAVPKRGSPRFWGIV